MLHRSIEFHGIEELVPSGEGLRLCRYPAQVRARLDDPACEAPFYCAGAELRMRLGSGGARIRLKRDAQTGVNPIGIAEVLYGSFHGDWRSSPRFVTTAGDWIELRPPEGLEDLKRLARESGDPWDPGLCRLILPYDFGCRFVDAEGDIAPPEAGQAPARRLLCYGSSITHGGTAVRPTETWAMRLASSLGMDLVNLGLAGKARLEPAVAEWIAARRDWDICVLELGINLIDSMSVEGFAARARDFVSIIAKARPEAPLFVIDLVPNGRDLRGDGGKIAAYRAAVAAATAVAMTTATSSRAIHVDGQSLLGPATGLCEGLLHPSPRGHEDMARRLGSVIEGAVQKVRRSSLDSFHNAAFAHRFNETGANARAVSEATNFRDCPGTNSR
jgi:lysophospholipase L1-like esterase